MSKISCTVCPVLLELNVGIVGQCRHRRRTVEWRVAVSAKRLQTIFLLLFTQAECMHCGQV